MEFFKKAEFKKNKNKFGIFIVSLPVLLSSIYFYSIGRSRYFVRSDVIVRKASNNTSNSIDLSNLIGAGNQSSLEDALFLQTYLESPQVLRKLEKELYFIKYYSKT